MIISADHFYGQPGGGTLGAAAGGLDTILETAGLAIAVRRFKRLLLDLCLDNLIGIDTPKVGPMLSTAICGGHQGILFQAEREVFRHQVEAVNPRARILDINGLTGQGALSLKTDS